MNKSIRMEGVGTKSRTIESRMINTANQPILGPLVRPWIWGKKENENRVRVAQGVVVGEREKRSWFVFSFAPSTRVNNLLYAFSPRQSPDHLPSHCWNGQWACSSLWRPLPEILTLRLLFRFDNGHRSLPWPP